MKFKVFIILLVIIFNYSCSNKPEKKIVIIEKSIEDKMIEAYEEGLKEIDLMKLKFYFRNLIWLQNLL